MSDPCDTLEFRLPTHGDAILSKMNALREDRLFCDITLLLGSPERFDFHGHRVVLAASSDFPRDQFLLHEGQAELSLGVVSSVGVGRRLLLSCYTGLLEVPLRELVNYLSAASALQMSQVVERCVHAVSQYLSPTLASLELEKQSEEREILQPHSVRNQEEKDGEPSSTSSREADTQEGGGIGIQSKSKVTQGNEVDTRGVREAQFTNVKSPEDAACCFGTQEPEEGGFSHDDHTKKSSEKVQEPTSSSSLGTPPQHGQAAERSQSPEEILSAADQLQERGDPMDSCLLGTSGTRLPNARQDSGSTSAARQRPYLCRRCDRVLQHPESYAGHLRQHRQHLCLVCGRGFSQRMHLFHHIHVYTGFKPLRCPLCHKAFAPKAPLADHFNLHTGDRPHESDSCAVHLANKPGLRRHLKDVHGKSRLQNMLEEAVDSQ